LIYHLSRRKILNDDEAKINGKSSKIRMLVCVTVYNESREDLFKTLDGIYDNLKKFKEIGLSQWGNINFLIFKLDLNIFFNFI